LSRVRNKRLKHMEKRLRMMMSMSQILQKKMSMKTKRTSKRLLTKLKRKKVWMLTMSSSSMMSWFKVVMKS
jgi:hypothetical protein